MKKFHGHLSAFLLALAGQLSACSEASVSEPNSVATLTGPSLELTNLFGSLSRADVLTLLKSSSVAPLLNGGSSEAANIDNVVVPAFAHLQDLWTAIGYDPAAATDTGWSEKLSRLSAGPSGLALVGDDTTDEGGLSLCPEVEAGITQFFTANPDQLFGRFMMSFPVGKYQAHCTNRVDANGTCKLMAYLTPNFGSFANRELRYPVNQADLDVLKNRLTAARYAALPECRKKVWRRITTNIVNSATQSDQPDFGANEAD